MHGKKAIFILITIFFFVSCKSTRLPGNDESAEKARGDMRELQGGQGESAAEAAGITAGLGFITEEIDRTAEQFSDLGIIITAGKEIDEEFAGILRDIYQQPAGDQRDLAENSGSDADEIQQTENKISYLYIYNSCYGSFNYNLYNYKNKKEIDTSVV